MCRSFQQRIEIRCHMLLCLYFLCVWVPPSQNAIQCTKVINVTCGTSHICWTSSARISSTPSSKAKVTSCTVQNCCDG